MSQSRSRRAFLYRTLAGSTFPWFAGSKLAPGATFQKADPDLIVRSSRPLDAETPVEVFDRFLTPNRLFFVRSHFGPPAVGLSPWTLEVDGLVEKPLAFSLDDLKGLETVTVPAVLQCAGNGRGFFAPIIPGVGWEKGAVGNAEWSGVRLVDVLNRSGIKPEAAHVQLHGADTPPNPKTPAYFRSIPLTRALDPSTILATSMNGEPLPLLHGGPIRLVVPTWAGNHWIKWLRKITVAKEEAPGFYMQTGYKMPKVPTPPGVDLKPDQLKSVTTLNVKSLIARPLEGSTLKAGPVEVKGVAWTGEGFVEKVEISTGAGWSLATLQGKPAPGTWREWTYTWQAQPGRQTIQARATDSQGEIQPETTPWNRSGYLWNAIDKVTCEVR
jgi:DMSO/TMAO reductase YedYZ molybdopterin-dependent catalytic subunit